MQLRYTVPSTLLASTLCGLCCFLNLCGAPVRGMQQKALKTHFYGAYNISWKFYQVLFKLLSTVPNKQWPADPATIFSDVMRTSS